MKKFLPIVLSLVFSLTLFWGGCALKGNHTHSMTYVEAKEKTCIEDGNYEYWICSGCNKVFKDSKGIKKTTLEERTIVANGHDCTEATCEKPKSCKNCDYTEGVALEHDWTGACDTVCNRDGCNETRDAGSHLDEDENDVCDVCGGAVSSQSGNGSNTVLPKDEF